MSWTTFLSLLPHVCCLTGQFQTQPNPSTKSTPWLESGSSSPGYPAVLLLSWITFRHPFAKMMCVGTTGRALCLQHLLQGHRVWQALSPLGLKGIQIGQQEIIVEAQNSLHPWTKDSAVGEFSHVRCQLQKLICP